MDNDSELSSIFDQREQRSYERSRSKSKDKKWRKTMSRRPGSPALEGYPPNESRENKIRKHFVFDEDVKSLRTKSPRVYLRCPTVDRFHIKTVDEMIAEKHDIPIYCDYGQNNYSDYYKCTDTGEELSTRVERIIKEKREKKKNNSKRERLKRLKARKSTPL